MTDAQEDRLDLSAWDAPEPPAGLADEVIARIGGTSTTVDGVIASGPDEPPQPRRRAWRIAWIAAATLATAAAVLLVMRGTHRAAPTSGTVIAEQARALSLDSVQANLDPGAQVSWHREGAALVVAQRSGTVAWRVSGDDKLMIDAGATVALVEATGASLRVEVKMNQADARVIGLTALTAAAVSLVTVVVYEGHVKVSGSRGQPTVIVEPGSTYTVSPPTTKLVDPPVVGASVTPPTAADLRIIAGESPTIHVAEMPVDVQVDMPYDCALVLDGVAQTEMVSLDEGDHAYRIDCKKAYNTDAIARAASLDGKAGTVTVVRDDMSAGVAEGGPVLSVDKTEWTDDRVLIAGHTMTSVTAVSLSSQAVDVPVLDGQFLASMPNEHVVSLRLVDVQRGVHYFVLRRPKAVAAGPSTVSPACDATKLKDQALDRINLGQHAAALVLLERALACKPGDAYLTQLAFMSACSARDQPKAIKHYKKLSTSAQDKFKQICIRNSINVDAAPAPVTCDAESSKEKGMTNINMGQHAAALAQFEQSLRCKNDPYVLQLAFMESCASNNAAKANFYYPKLTRSQRDKFRQICIRQKPPVKLVEIDDLDLDDEGDTANGYLAVTSRPTASILIDGKDTGLETPISGRDLKLAPGKHKVTFVIGEDRFTYPVVIRAGATETLSKDLQ